MLGNSVVVVAVVAVVAVVRMRPRATPLAMITMRKSTHGFLFLSYMSMGLRLVALQAAGAPLKSLFASDTSTYCSLSRLFMSLGSQRVYNNLKYVLVISIK